MEWKLRAVNLALRVAPKPLVLWAAKRTSLGREVDKLRKELTMETTGTKNPLTSATLWGILGTVLGYFGIAVPADFAAAVARVASGNINPNDIVVIVGAGLAIWGRFRATRPLALGPSTPAGPAPTGGGIIRG